MSVVISIRVPRELKEKMDRIKGVNWSEEIRKFIEERITQFEVERLLEKVKEDLRDIPELPPGTIAGWLRSDRDSH